MVAVAAAVVVAHPIPLAKDRMCTVSLRLVMASGATATSSTVSRSTGPGSPNVPRFNLDMVAVVVVHPAAAQHLVVRSSRHLVPLLATRRVVVVAVVEVVEVVAVAMARCTSPSVTCRPCHITPAPRSGGERPPTVTAQVSVVVFHCRCCCRCRCRRSEIAAGRVSLPVCMQGRCVFMHMSVLSTPPGRYVLPCCAGSGSGGLDVGRVSATPFAYPPPSVTTRPPLPQSAPMSMSSATPQRPPLTFSPGFSNWSAHSPDMAVRATAAVCTGLPTLSHAGTPSPLPDPRCGTARDVVVVVVLLLPSTASASRRITFSWRRLVWQAPVPKPGELSPRGYGVRHSFSAADTGISEPHPRLRPSTMPGTQNAHW